MHELAWEGTRAREDGRTRTRWWVRGTAALACVHLFGLLQNSPLQPYVWRYDFLITLGLCGFAALYAALRLLNDGLRVSGLEACVLVVAGAFPLYSAWRAGVVFGQPLLYGVLAQRNMLMAFYALVAASALRSGRLRLADAERILLALCWVSAAAFYAVTVARALGWEPAPILEGSEVRFGRNNFNVILMAFGVCYYFVRYVREGSARSGAALAFLLASIVLVREARGITVALIVALGFYLVGSATWRQKRRFLRLSGGLLLVLALSVVAVPGLTGRLAEVGVLFGEAAAVVLGGSSDDFSASARVVQFAKALPYLQDHLLLGNGLLSAQWQGGFERLLGYFHPADLGIVGVVFLYGLAGVVLFSVQLVVAYRVVRRIDRRRASTFALALHVFLGYLYALSLITGLVLVAVGISLVVLALLIAAVREGERARGAALRISGSA